MKTRIASIQVGLPQDYGQEAAEDVMDRPWSTGFFKLPVTGDVWLDQTHLVGDGQADLVHHGGPDKAVLAYSASHYPDWRRSLDKPELPYGAFGENFTVDGLAEAEVCIGDTWQVGDDVIVQVSQPRQPCWKLARRWRIKSLASQVQETGHTGWYFRVLKAGHVHAGMPLSLLERPSPLWSVAHANRVMHHDKHNLSAALELAALPRLSDSWRSTLTQRVRQQESNPQKRLIGENE